MLRRNASAPARSKRSSISGSRLAGPTVARILTLRVRGWNFRIEGGLCQSRATIQGSYEMAQIPDAPSDSLDDLPDAVAAQAFRRLVRHLRHRSDAQNIDLMGLAGFCRNCLADWIAEADGLSKEEGRAIVYGMPAAEWKARHQTEATPEQLERMQESMKRNHVEDQLDDALDDSFPASDPPAMTDPSR